MDRSSQLFQKTTSDLKQEREARRRSREIDVMIKRTSATPVVIYLCGEGQSGKNTFLKQMRIINGPEFSHRELLEYRRTVYNNTIRDMQVLLEEKNRLGLTWQNSANEMNEMLVKCVETWKMDSDPCTFQRYTQVLLHLSGRILGCRKLIASGLMQPYETVRYFFDNMDRIGQLSYVPCHQDILYARTLFFWEQLFVFRNIMIVGSHNRPRHCGVFNNILLFIAASNEYDKVLDEDKFCSEVDNSLLVSLRLFERIIKNRFFLNSTIILFLNKTDLLAEKVKTADIRKNFPEFSGDPHSLEEVQEFLLQLFRQKMENDSRTFYHHFTTAVDTENIRIAFDRVKDIIMQRNLKNVTSI